MRVHQVKTQLDGDTLDFFRSTLYLGQSNVMPKSIAWQGDAPIDADVLARRIGLIPFRVPDVNREYEVAIDNDTDQWRLISAEELNTPELLAEMPREVLVHLPPHTRFEFRIKFDRGYGVDHARYDLLVKEFSRDGWIRITHPYAQIKNVLQACRAECLSMTQKITP